MSSQPDPLSTTQCRRFIGKTVLVTGAASGIGLAAARRFAAEGASVVIADLSAAGHEAVDALAADGADALFVRCDCTAEDDVAALVDQAAAWRGRLDVAINNVGTTAQADRRGAIMHEADVTAWHETISLNLLSTMLGMKHQIRVMLAQDGGVIANTGSMAGIAVTRFSSAAYAASKAGVAHLTRWAAVLYARDNIRVNLVAPGLTLTPNIERNIPLDRRVAIVDEFHADGRETLPEDHAAAFAWLCSDEARGVTGLVVPVSGGWAAR